MAIIDDITELAQDTYYSINGAENDDTDEDLELFQNGFIRAFNLWMREYETEAYWKVARVLDYELATIADTSTYSFALPAEYRTPIFEQDKYLKFVLDDGTGEDRIILSGIHAYYEPEELVGKTLIAITNLPPRKMMGIDSCGMLLSAIHQEEGEEKLHLLIVDRHIPAGAKLY